MHLGGGGEVVAGGPVPPVPRKIGMTWAKNFRTSIASETGSSAIRMHRRFVSMRRAKYSADVGGGGVGGSNRPKAAGPWTGQGTEWRPLAVLPPLLIVTGN